MLTVKINKYYLTLSALLQELFLDKLKICDLIIDKGGTIAFIKAHRMEIKIIRRLWSHEQYNYKRRKK